MKWPEIFKIVPEVFKIVPEVFKIVPEVFKIVPEVFKIVPVKCFYMMAHEFFHFLSCLQNITSNE